MLRKIAKPTYSKPTYALPAFQVPGAVVSSGPDASTISPGMSLGIGIGYGV